MLKKTYHDGNDYGIWHQIKPTQSGLNIG